MFRKIITRALPAGAEIRTVRGEQQARIRLDGRMQWVALNKSGRTVCQSSAWYAKIKQSDGTVKVTRLARDKTSALKVQTDLRVRRERVSAGLENPVEEGTDCSMSALLAGFEAAQRSKGNKLKYDASLFFHLRAMLDALKLSSLRELRNLTAGAVECWARSQTAPGGTVNQYLISLKLFLAWLKKQKLINEVITFPSVNSRPVEKRHAFTITEVERLATVAPWPFGLLYRLAFTTIARQGALLSLLREDLHLDDAQGAWMSLRPEHAKTGQGQGVPLAFKLVDDLRRLKADTDAGARIFPFRAPALHRQLQLDLAAAGIAKRSPGGLACFHSFRHGGASHLLKNGVSAHLVQRLGGWQSLEMLERTYSHLTSMDGRDAIRAVFEQ